MKKAFIFSIIILISSFCGFAQKKTATSRLLKPIKLSFYLSDEIIKSFEREPTLRYYDRYTSLTSSDCESFPLTIKNNRTSITIQPKSPFGYFEFRGKFIPSIYLDLFFVQAGDSVCLNVENLDKARFIGKGAPRLNYQLFVGKLFFTNIKNPYQLTSLAHPVENLEFYKQKANHQINAALDSLNKLRSTLDKNVFDVLRLASTCTIYQEYSNAIVVSYPKLDSVNKVMVMAETTSLLTLATGYQINDQFILDHAFEFVDYIYGLQYKLTRLKKQDYNIEVPYRPDVYEIFKNQYTGILRDKLVAHFLLGNQRFDNQKIIAEASKYVQDVSSKKILTNLQNSEIPGSWMYDFNLEDEDGRTVRRDDFKGKLVVMDTWFNGCSGCIILAEKMKPVMDYYKANNKVVFLSVNTDVMKARFLDGVKKGLYGTSQSFYVFTGGRGQMDPLIKFYHYYQYPNLLLFNKYGKIVSTNPPRPYNDKGKNELIELIEKNL